MLPDFDDRGFLPPGVHRASAADFLKRFARGKHRAEFSPALENVFNYAVAAGASSVLIGGSFITDQTNPSDVDCVILFRVEGQIPAIRDSLDFDAKSIDIFFASKDQPKIVGSFLRLFSNNLYGESVGVIEIILRDGRRSDWEVTWEPDEDTFDIVKRMYVGKRHVETIKRKKVLVTIHGIRSHAEWNAEVTLVASANGWVVAPFHYGYVQPTIFAARAARREIVERFRDHLASVSALTGVQSVSVLAHSFGTYIAMNYIKGFDLPPVTFDTLILAGAIVDEKLDFSDFNGKVGYVINEIAPNDEWAEWAKIANFGIDEMFGKAATIGFSHDSDRLIQHRSTIFTHNNVIKRDVMVARWMPALEANLGSAAKDALDKLIREARN